MKNILYLFILTIFISCGNEKTLLLPEIEQSDITELQDVSAAYLFYDETKKDSVELNRKNLISTTNWLVNVDKRLTLKQAIPLIKFLQEKKSNSSHKNEKAKNYFTCNDLSKKNLGFVEFTHVIYVENSSWEGAAKKSQIDMNKTIHIQIHSLEVINIVTNLKGSNLLQTDIKNLKSNILKITENINDKITLTVDITNALLFQDYISIKSNLAKLNLENITLSKTEYIY